MIRINKRNLLLLPLLGCLLCTQMGAQTVSLSTNIADYADLGTLNLESSYRLSRHFTLVGGLKYNPFSFRTMSSGDGKADETSSPDTGQGFRKQRLISAGTRYWPWYVFSGWWLGCKLQYQEYSTGGISSERTVDGDRYGTGLSAGYSYMLGKHFNLDIGFGAWAGYETYSTYSCPVCGDVENIGARYFFLPNDLTLSLSYVF